MKKKTPSIKFGVIFLVTSILFALVVIGYPYVNSYLKDNSTLSLNIDISNTANNYEPVENVENVQEVDSNKGSEDENVLGTTFVQPKGSVKIPVLMYHQIGAVPTKGSIFAKNLYVTPYMFEQQMKYLKNNGYKTITPQQFYDYLKSGKNPKQKSVLLTFDDGSVGQYKYAYPILKKYGLTGTFYIVSQKSPITTTQLKRMSDNGMVIDSHSTLHEDLRVLNSKSQIKLEVDRSKRQLEYVTKKKIVSIAYPGCVADSAVFNQVATSGYKLGFSCGKTIYHYYKNRLYLSRIHVFNNLSTFQRALVIGL